MLYFVCYSSVSPPSISASPLTSSLPDPPPTAPRTRTPSAGSGSGFGFRFRPRPGLGPRCGSAASARAAATRSRECVRHLRRGEGKRKESKNGKVVCCLRGLQKKNDFPNETDIFKTLYQYI